MYDTFISYRRDNGFYIARLVRDQLEKRGISAFLDLEELRSGKFNEKLYEVIRNSKNFILILPSGALDRCVNEDDWVRKEVEHAIAQNKNIVPIALTTEGSYHIVAAVYTAVHPFCGTRKVIVKHEVVNHVHHQHFCAMCLGLQVAEDVLYV